MKSMHQYLRPDAEIKNLSRGLNLSRFSNRLVSLEIVSNVSRFKPALNLNRVLADLSRVLNSLNSATGRLDYLSSLSLKKKINILDGEFLYFISAVILIKQISDLSELFWI